jgi:protein-tyrosine phosphatase
MEVNNGSISSRRFKKNLWLNINHNEGLLIDNASSGGIVPTTPVTQTSLSTTTQTSSTFTTITRSNGNIVNDNIINNQFNINNNKSEDNNNNYTSYSIHRNPTNHSSTHIFINSGQTTINKFKRRPSAALSISIPDSKASFEEDNKLRYSRNDSIIISDENISPNFSSEPQQQNLPTIQQQQNSSEAYPNGPILVYPPNIYLYSEPDLSTASNFDVIVNVAKEVKNPFSDLSYSPISREDLDNLLANANANNTGSIMMNSPSISSAEQTPDLSTSPSTTSTCSSSSFNRNPEYLYIPWDHNSQLIDDLERLTTYIYEKSQQGKRILIHCQCGVSRSASLVVAYVMKQNHWNVNTAYQYLKDQSPKISPNMTLMFQLMDWQKMLNISSNMNGGGCNKYCDYPLSPTTIGHPEAV